MPKFRYRRVKTSDGVTLNVVEAGLLDRPAMVFVHGLASSWRAWERVMAAPELASRYRLIAFDLRGHGDSDLALKPEQLLAEGPVASSRLWSHDLDAVLTGVLSPVLVGWSFGSGVVQSWLYTHGGVLDAQAVVLACAPNVIGPVHPGDPAETLMTPEALSALAGAAQDGVTYADVILANAPTDRTYSPYQAKAFATVAESTPAETVEGVLHHLIDFRPFLRTLTSAQRARITTLIASGDQLFDAAATDAVWKQVGIRTVHVPGAAHALPIREPERLAQLLTDLADLRSG